MAKHIKSLASDMLQPGMEMSLRVFLEQCGVSEDEFKAHKDKEEFLIQLMSR